MMIEIRPGKWINEKIIRQVCVLYDDSRSWAVIDAGYEEDIMFEFPTPEEAHEYVTDLCARINENSVGARLEEMSIKLTRIREELQKR